MSFRAVLLFMVIISGVAVGLLTYVNLQATPTREVHVDAGVIVAAAGIPTGHLIQPQDLKFGPPSGSENSDTVFTRLVANNATDQAEADRKSIDAVVGAVARRRFDPGDAIIRNEVVKPGDSGFLAAVLQPGMRAITIGVTAVSGAGGLIYPGDRVDVILTQTFNTPDITLDRRSAAEIVGRDLRVLAIDQQLQAGAKAGPEGKLAQTVTLETDPRQATEIEVAAKLGDLSLTIRSLQSGVASAAVPGSPAAKLDQGAVWASDVSSALKTVAGERPKTSFGSAGQAVTVMHGERAETISSGERK